MQAQIYSEAGSPKSVILFGGFFISGMNSDTKRAIHTARAANLHPVGLADVGLNNYLPHQQIDIRLNGDYSQRSLDIIDSAFRGNKWTLRKFLMDYNRMPGAYGRPTFRAFSPFICRLLDGTFDESWVDRDDLVVEVPVLVDFDWSDVTETAQRNHFQVQRIEPKDATLAQYDLSSQGQQELGEFKYISVKSFPNSIEKCPYFLRIQRPAVVPVL